jgi:hypothetical protein
MTDTEYVIEFALMVCWEDGDVEYIPAKDATHAERMAKTIYAGQSTYTVGREVQPWRYVNRGADTLTDAVAL